MSLLRPTTILIAALLLTTTAGIARATDVSMAGGSVHFSTPDTWLGIMQTDGDPEIRVFQVPGPSDSTTLARVTVTIKQVNGTDGFQTYVSSAADRAKTLTGYQPATHDSGETNSFTYTATESGTPFEYVERYWFKNGSAIQLRCVRPAQSEAGPAWKASFDKGCNAIAAAL
ncbi:MAG: hypothetical protein WA777_05830 [Rhodanobacter sp.]